MCYNLQDKYTIHIKCKIRGNLNIAESRQNPDEILRVINREGNSKYRGHRKKTFGYDAGYIESNKRLEWIPNSESMYRESGL